MTQPPPPDEPTRASAAAGTSVAQDDPPPARVGIGEIRAAAETLSGVARRTPLVPLGRPDRRHWLKAESLQPIGAFKIRGAYNAAAALPEAQRARGLITY